jgi:hypothetical protein
MSPFENYTTAIANELAFQPHSGKINAGRHVAKQVRMLAFWLKAPASDFDLG